jgi:predicted  nucleic acid-binding Zn-ribbon protein
VSDSPAISRLNKKRNLYVVIAVVSLAGSLGAALPRRVKSFNAHKQANAEWIRLQGEIVAAQGKIKNVQTEILRIQAELRSTSAR